MTRVYGKLQKRALCQPRPAASLSAEAGFCSSSPRCERALLTGDVDDLVLEIGSGALHFKLLLKL